MSPLLIALLIACGLVGGFLKLNQGRQLQVQAGLQLLAAVVGLAFFILVAYTLYTILA